MATDIKREKRRLARLKKSQQEKERLEAEINDLTEDDGDEDVSDSVAEVKQKDMGMDMPEPLPVATSFAELDKYKEMHERMEAINEASYEVRELVYNILHASPNLTVNEKAEKIQKVGSDFGARVQAVISQDVTQMSKEVDDLYVKALEATEKRHNSFPSKVKSLFKKPEPLTEIEVVDKWHSAVIVEKAVDGKWRAIMFPSNNFIDWHGDIISESAHLDYVEWVGKNMDCAPLFMTWHINGTARKEPVDFVGYENGFLIMSAPLTDDEAAGLLRVQAITDVGMSHTSIVLERDPSDSRVVSKYRIVEVTDLPLDAAANPFTDLDLITKEASMDTLTYLTNLLGSGTKAENFLKKAGIKQKELQEAEIPSKEKETPEGDPPAPETTPNPPAFTIEEVMERVSKEFGFEELSAQFAKIQESAEKVPVLESLVKELSKDRDDELAEMIQPPARKSLAWLNTRPSQSTETVLTDSEEDAKLKKSKPEVGWLSEVTKTTPVNQ